MVKVDRIVERKDKRILRCQEGNRIWYQLWIDDMDMGCIERYFPDCEVKRWWSIELQLWYVFFYEKKGYKIRGVLGRDRTRDLIRSILY